MILISTAFGQLKIADQVDAHILDEALAALRCQQWQHANLELSHLVQMQVVLKQL